MNSGPARALSAIAGWLLPAIALAAFDPSPLLADVAADVRSFGAVCDGKSDTAAAFQKAYDALTAAGGTIVVPAGATCAIGNDGVEPKSKVALRCEKGSRLRALPGARAMFRTRQTLDDWSVTGCEFDLGGVAVGAWESSAAEQGGARWSFRDNFVHGISSTEGESLVSVRLDCTLARGACQVTGNTIVGSGNAARRDTCLTVSAGGFIGSGTQLLGNYLDGCGANCLEVRSPGGVVATGNVLTRCFAGAVKNSSLNSVWSGNQLSTVGKDAGAVMTIVDTIGNQVIVGNQFAFNPHSSAPAIHAIARGANLAGLYIDGNYAAQGIWFDAQGSCAGGTCGSEACDDDGGCAACGGSCTGFGIFDHDHVANLIITGAIRIESATNLVVQGNIVIGRARAGSKSPILITNPRDDAPSGGIVVSGNQLAKWALPSTPLACIEFDDAGGGGFAGVTITGNSCGQDAAVAPGVRINGVRLTRPPRVWRSILIADNNFTHTLDALVGFDTPELRSATRLSGNLGLDAGDAQPVVESFRSVGDGVPAFAVVALAAGAAAAVDVASTAATNAVGCALEAIPGGASGPVAVGGVADCLVTGAESAIASGDALALRGRPGFLAKARPGERVFGYALDSNAGTRPMLVLIQPTAAAGAMTSVARTRVDTTRGSVLETDPSLAVPLTASKTYALDGLLRVQTEDAQSALATAALVPAGSTLDLVLRKEPTEAGHSSLLRETSTGPALVPLGTGDNVVSLAGTLSTAASAGALALRWAQANASGGPVVLQAGSWLRATELP